MIQESDIKVFFKNLVGKWEGEAKTFFKPNELADTSPIKGTIKEILGGLFLAHEYEGTLMGEKMIGFAIYGFNKKKKQFEMAWVDTVHQGSEIMYSIEKNTGMKFSVLGKYTNDDQSETWGWRTTIELISKNDLQIRHYNITPQNLEYIGVEITYKRF